MKKRRKNEKSAEMTLFCFLFFEYILFKFSLFDLIDTITIRLSTRK